MSRSLEEPLDENDLRTTWTTLEATFWDDALLPDDPGVEES